MPRRPRAATAPPRGPRSPATSRRTAATSTCARRSHAIRAGSSRCRSTRPRSSPTCRRTSSTRRRCASSPTWRANAASRRSATPCWPARRSTTPSGARCSTPRCARRAAARRSAHEVHAVLDAMLAFAETVRERAGGARRGDCATSSTSASAAATSARRWPFAPGRRRPSGPVVPLRRQRRRRRPGLGARPRRAGRDALRRRQQDLHDAGDDGQRRDRARLVRRPGRHADRGALRRRDEQRRGGRALRHHAHLRLLGLGRRPLFAVVGDRPADRDRDRRRALSRAARRRARDGRALRAGAGRAQPADAARPRRRLVPELPPLHEPLHRALRAGAATAACLPAAARDGKQRQAGRPQRRAAAVRDQPGRLGRAGDERAARLLPDAPPGQRRRPGRVHPAQAVEAVASGIAPEAIRASTGCCSPTAWRRARR